MAGSFHDPRGPMATPTEYPGYRMLGAVFEVGDRLHFVKGYGPEKTMAARADEFRPFLKSLKLKQSSQ